MDEDEKVTVMLPKAVVREWAAFYPDIELYGGFAQAVIKASKEALDAEAAATTPQAPQPLTEEGEENG